MGITMTGYQPPHVLNHQAGGIDPLNLALIAGNLTNAQHGPLDPDLHHNQVHGHDDHAEYRLTWLLPQDFVAVQGAPAITQYGAFPNCYSGWAFDPAADEAVMALVFPPVQDWAGRADCIVRIFWTINAAAAGNVRWAAHALAVQPWTAEVLTAAGMNQVGIAVPPAVDTIIFYAFTTAEAVALGDVVRIFIQRQGTDVLDTFPNDAVFLGAFVGWN